MIEEIINEDIQVEIPDGTFYEAWPKVKRLREICTREGKPRIGLKPEQVKEAKELIKKYGV